MRHKYLNLTSTDIAMPRERSCKKKRSVSYWILCATFDRFNPKIWRRGAKAQIADRSCHWNWHSKTGGALRSLTSSRSSKSDSLNHFPSNFASRLNLLENKNYYDSFHHYGSNRRKLSSTSIRDIGRVAGMMIRILPVWCRRRTAIRIVARTREPQTPTIQVSRIRVVGRHPVKPEWSKLLLFSKMSSIFIDKRIQESFKANIEKQATKVEHKPTRQALSCWMVDKRFYVKKRQSTPKNKKMILKVGIMRIKSASNIHCN